MQTSRSNPFASCFRVPIVTLLVLATCACGAEDAPQGVASAQAPAPEQPASASNGETRTETVLGLSYDVPSAWEVVPTDGGMRKAQYSIGDATTLVLFHFGVGGGGGVEDNMERWIGQVSQPDGSPSDALARRETRALDGGLVLHTLDVSGNWSGGMSGGGGPGHRFLGAVVEAPGGPFFLRLTGPEAQVAAAAPGFEALCASMRVEG